MFMRGNWPPWLFSVAIVSFYGSGLVFQIYRYWRVSSPGQRQQTKWVLFAFGVFLLVTILDSLIGGFFRSSISPTRFTMWSMQR